MCTIYSSGNLHMDSNLRIRTTYSSDDLYTEEDIKIMAGEKSPTTVHNPSTSSVTVHNPSCYGTQPCYNSHVTVHNPSTSSVAAFFANACEQEQKEQERSDSNVCANGSELQQPPSIKPPDSGHNVNAMHQHPPSGVVTGGPPGIGLTLQNTAAPMPGTYPLIVIWLMLLCLEIIRIIN